MKKLVTFVLTLSAILTLSACTTTGDLDINAIKEELLSSEESLATLSYLSAGFLDFSSPSVSTGIQFLNNQEPTEIEDELEEVNVYFDRLKAIIDNGIESFGSITEEASDNELYQYKLTFTVNEEVYVIYYNIDAVTLEMTGVIVVGDQEYTFEVVDNMHEYKYQEQDKPEVDDEDEDEDLDTEETTSEPQAAPPVSSSSEDEEDDVDTEEDDELDTEEDEDDELEEESETKMMLIATNGEDTIKIIYKTETDGEETETKFFLEQTIAGVTKEIALKISVEEDEFKVQITENDNTYTFKQEVEDDEVVYKLNYKVDGVVGMVRITEILNEDGTVSYDYHIVEAGQERHVEKEEPHSKGFDDDEDEQEDEDEEEDDL